MGVVKRGAFVALMLLALCAPVVAAGAEAGMQGALAGTSGDYPLASWTLPERWKVEGGASGASMLFSFSEIANGVWSQGGAIDVVRVTPGSDLAKKGLRFTSKDDFAARAPSMWGAADFPTDEVTGPEDVTIDGRPAWKLTSMRTARPGSAPGQLDYELRQVVRYWVPQGDGGVFVRSEAAVGWFDKPGAADHTRDFEALAAERDAIVGSFKLRDMSADAPAGVGWRTVAGGLAAVAAAAAALAGAFASSARGKANTDPNLVIGYILQLSSRSLKVTRDAQAPLTATAYRVRASGAYEVATDATIALVAPPGIAVAPASGAGGTIGAGVWQTGQVASPAAITVSAHAPGSSATERVTLAAESATELVVAFDPAGKTALIPNDRDSVTLVATVSPSDGQWPPGVDAEAVRRSISFRALDRWVYISEPADWPGGGRAVRAAGQQPDPARPVAPPVSAGVEVTATVGTETLSKVVAIGLMRQPTLDASPDDVTLAAGSGDAVRVALTVKDPGAASWRYRAQWADESTAIAECDIVEQSASTATLTLTEAAADGAAAESPTTCSTLRLFAIADGFEEIERRITVGVLREGLFAETISKHPDGTYHVRADGSKRPQTIFFRAYVRDPATGRIAADPKAVTALKFEPLDEPGTRERGTAEFARVSARYAPKRASRPEEGPYDVAYEREVPGKAGEIVKVRYLATSPGLDPDTFFCEFALGLETTAPETDSPEWQAEYKRASDIIDRLMPVAYRAGWHRTLDAKAQVLGVEGLAELRKRIWFNAADLVLAEGAEGYLAEANWADRIVSALDLAQMLGDIAFNYLVSIYLGPLGAQAAQAAKPMLIQATVDVLDEKDIAEILSNQMGAVLMIFEGKVVDMDAWQRLTGASKAKCWMAFVGYHFAKAVLWEKKPFMEAVRTAAAQARDVVVFGWIQKQLHAFAGTKPYANYPAPGQPTGAGAGKPGAPAAKTSAAPAPATAAAPAAKRAKDPKPAPARATTSRKKDDVAPARDHEITGTKPGDPVPKPAKPARPKPLPPKAPRPVETESSDAVRRSTTIGHDGKPYADRDTVLDIMRDPQRVRDLKTASPEVQAAFNNTRNQIYRTHDAQVLRDLRSQPGMRGRRLAVVDVRTPGSDPHSVNTDRDFRVVEVRRNPNTGMDEAIEVPLRQWKGSSDRAFAAATGGPADPAGAAAWSRGHQQMATDRFHAEASPDMARQGFVRDPDTGQWRQAQVRPNIERVAAGESTLHDPEALGQTYKTKVADAIHEGNHGDAYVQAGKAVETMTQVRAGYARQGYEVGDLPQNLRQGMAAVGEGRTNFNDPAAIAAADARLKEAGFRGGLPDFMDKLSGQIESLKNAKQRS